MGSKERTISRIFTNLELDFLKEVIASTRDVIGNKAYPKMSEYVGDMDKFSVFRFINNKRKDSARKMKL